MNFPLHVFYFTFTTDKIPFILHLYLFVVLFGPYKAVLSAQSPLSVMAWETYTPEIKICTLPQR